MRRGSDESSRAGHVNLIVEDLTGRVFARARGFNTLEDGLVEVLVPRFDGAILGRFLMPRLKKPFFSIRLDKFGSFVWLRIDGVTTVGKIYELFDAQNPGEEMSRERVALFVRALAMQKHLMEVDAPVALVECGPLADNSTPE